jgi:hypothetical protein
MCETIESINYYYSNDTVLDCVNTILGICTPIILLLWFLFSQWNRISKSYLEEIPGLYAGFTPHVVDIDNASGLQSGMIMKIRDVNVNGYFRGQFDFREQRTYVMNENALRSDRLRDGIFTFIGKINYKYYLPKKRHPYRLVENRTYKGIMYIVDRLDFDLGKQSFEDFLSAEYEFAHYRELKEIKFIRKKMYKVDRPLPAKFTLYKAVDTRSEPYIHVKAVVFNGESRVDTGVDF